MPIQAIIVIIALASGFASGALPVDVHKPVELHKLLEGKAEYKVNN